MTTHVTETAAAQSELAIKHFQDMLAFETDCRDVHESLKSTGACAHKIANLINVRFGLLCGLQVGHHPRSEKGQRTKSLAR
jgi:hypothetical protein